MIVPLVKLLIELTLVQLLPIVLALAVRILHVLAICGRHRIIPHLLLHQVSLLHLGIVLRILIGNLILLGAGRHAFGNHKLKCFYYI